MTVTLLLKSDINYHLLPFYSYSTPDKTILITQKRYKNDIKNEKNAENTIRNQK